MAHLLFKLPYPERSKPIRLITYLPKADENDESKIVSISEPGYDEL